MICDDDLLLGDDLCFDNPLLAMMQSQLLWTLNPKTLKLGNKISQELTTD
jgi:hypothetical protein